MKSYKNTPGPDPSVQLKIICTSLAQLALRLFQRDSTLNTSTVYLLFNSIYTLFYIKLQIKLSVCLSVRIESAHTCTRLSRWVASRLWSLSAWSACFIPFVSQWFSEISPDSLLMVRRLACWTQEWSMSHFVCSLTRNITSHSMENLAFHSSLPRVINVTFRLQPHQKYYITQYEELGLS